MDKNIFTVEAAPAADEEEAKRRRVDAESSTVSMATTPSSAAFATGLGDLSPGEQRMLAMMNHTVAAQISPLTSQMQAMTFQINQVGGAIQQVKTTVDEHAKRLDQVDRELAQLRAGGSGGSANAPSQTGGGGGQAPYAVGSASGWRSGPPVPKAQRTVVIVGGFPPEGEREVVERAAAEISAQIPGVQSAFAVGRRPSVFKMRFESASLMWEFMRARRGRRLEFEGRTLWHTVEKDPEERLVAKRVSNLIGKLRTATGLEPAEFKGKFPDTDYDRGIIFIKDASSPSGARRLFAIPKNGKMMEFNKEAWPLTGLDASKEDTDPERWVSEANSLTL